MTSLCGTQFELSMMTLRKLKLKKKKVMVPYANNQTIEALRRLPPLIITG